MIEATGIAEVALTILDWPGWADKGDEIREVRDTETKVRLGAHFPFLLCFLSICVRAGERSGQAYLEVNPAPADDREAWLVRDIEALKPEVSLSLTRSVKIAAYL